MLYFTETPKHPLFTYFYITICLLNQRIPKIFYGLEEWQVKKKSQKTSCKIIILCFLCNQYIRTKLFKLRYILVHSFSFSFLFCQCLIRKKQTILPSIANIFFLVQTFTIYFLLIRDLPSFGLYMVLYNNILNQCGSDSDYCQFFAGGMTGVDFYIFLLF